MEYGTLLWTEHQSSNAKWYWLFGDAKSGHLLGHLSFLPSCTVFAMCTCKLSWIISIPFSLPLILKQCLTTPVGGESGSGNLGILAWGRV